MWTKLMQSRLFIPKVLGVLGIASCLLLPGMARAQGVETQRQSLDANRFDSPIDQLDRLGHQHMGDPFDLLRPPAANPEFQENDRRLDVERLQNERQSQAETDPSDDFRDSSLTNQNPTPRLMQTR